MSDRDRDRDRKRRDYYDDDRYDKRSKKDDHHSSKRNEPSKDERPHEFIDINWKDYQSYVDGIFFKKSDLIRKGSADYDEFWGTSSPAQSLTIRLSRKIHLIQTSKTSQKY